MEKYRDLKSTERMYICLFICALVPVARDQRHPMRKLARREIARSLWRWTADAVEIKSGAVKQDGFKYDCRVHPHTIEASKAQRKERRHEHAVPRMLLADRIIDTNLNEEGVFKLLERFCRAVVVTKEQDSRLKPRHKMPEGWKWK